MNDRIKSLFGQALDQAVPYTWTMLGRDEVEHIVNCFAESIIKECANVAIHTDTGMFDTADRAGLIAAGRLEAAQIIKQHFGVIE